MKLSTKIIIHTSVSLVVFILLVVTFLNVKSKVESCSSKVVQTNETLKKLSDLQKKVMIMEASLGEYLISGKEEYLHTYNKTFSEYSLMLIEVKKFFIENRDQEEKVKVIATLMSDWKMLAQRSVNDYSYTDTVQDKIRNDNRGEIMNEVLTKFNELDAEESRLLQVRLDVLNASIAVSNKVVIVLTGFSIIFVLLLSFLIIKSVSERMANLVKVTDMVAKGKFDVGIYDESKDELGELANSFNVMVSRLSEAFQEIDVANEKLLNSEKRFRQLVEGANDIIYKSDYKGNFTYVNPVAIRITGFEEKELLSKNFTQLIVKEQVEEVQNFYYDQFINNAPDTYKEFQINTKEGHTIWIGQNVHLISEQGKITGFLAVARNITKRKEIEIELMEARRVSDQALKEKEVFLATVSHEIRTPMNAIIGFSELLSKTILEKEQEEFVKAIHISSEGLLGLINDMLDFSKIEAGKITFEKIDFSLREIISNSMKVIGQKAREKNLQLIKNIPENIPDKLVGDPHRLNQILLNLLSNAIKFTEKGHVSVGIEKIKKTAKHTVLRFTIKDTGIGIPKDKLKSIFESFTQASADTTRKFGGTGLGLSIVKSLVELQGGSIKVHSELGKGADFSFTMKFAICNTVEQVPSQTTDLVNTLPKKQIRILLVEDNHLNQLLARKVLSDCHMSMEVADNGKVAIEKLKANTYDVILMDISMPEMDGYTATHYIRNNFPEPVNSIPIIAMTANALNGEEQKCKKAGMDAYLSKPFRPEELISKIGALLNKGIFKVEIFPENNKKEIPVHTPKHINLEYLQMLSNEDKEFMNEMILSFFNHKDQFLESIKIHLKDMNWEEIGKAAHKMKSSISLMGIHSLNDPLFMIEEFALTKKGWRNCLF